MKKLIVLLTFLIPILAFGDELRTWAPVQILLEPVRQRFVALDAMTSTTELQNQEIADLEIALIHFACLNNGHNKIVEQWEASSGMVYTSDNYLTFIEGLTTINDTVYENEVTSACTAAGCPAFITNVCSYMPDNYLFELIEIGTKWGVINPDFTKPIGESYFTTENLPWLSYLERTYDMAYQFANFENITCFHTSSNCSDDSTNKQCDIDMFIQYMPSNNSSSLTIDSGNCRLGSENWELGEILSGDDSVDSFLHNNLFNLTSPSDQPYGALFSVETNPVGTFDNTFYCDYPVAAPWPLRTEEVKDALHATVVNETYYENLECVIPAPALHYTAGGHARYLISDTELSYLNAPRTVDANYVAAANLTSADIAVGHYSKIWDRVTQDFFNPEKDNFPVCTDTTYGVFWECEEGYEPIGGKCELIDECETTNPLYQDNCHVNADCTNVDPGFTCTCKAGYAGDGVDCTEINECNPNPCNTGSCNDEVNSYTCDCTDTGYEGINCENDIDECTLETDDCHNNAACTDTPGSYTCTCNVGYTGDGEDCENIDECTTDTDNCHDNAACTDTPGSFTCACNSGYEGDGVTTCTDINECTGTDVDGNPLHNCGDNTTCSNKENGFDCVCSGTLPIVIGKTNSWIPYTYTEGTGDAAVELEGCIARYENGQCVDDDGVAFPAGNPNGAAEWMELIDIEDNPLIVEEDGSFLQTWTGEKYEPEVSECNWDCKKAPAEFTKTGGECVYDHIEISCGIDLPENSEWMSSNSDGNYVPTDFNYNTGLWTPLPGLDDECKKYKCVITDNKDYQAINGDGAAMTNEAPNSCDYRWEKSYEGTTSTSNGSVVNLLQRLNVSHDKYFQFEWTPEYSPDSFWGYPETRVSFDVRSKESTSPFFLGGLVTWFYNFFLFDENDDSNVVRTFAQKEHDLNYTSYETTNVFKRAVKRAADSVLSVFTSLTIDDMLINPDIFIISDASKISCGLARTSDLPYPNYSKTYGKCLSGTCCEQMSNGVCATPKEWAWDFTQDVCSKVRWMVSFEPIEIPTDRIVDIPKLSTTEYIIAPVTNIDDGWGSDSNY